MARGNGGAARARRAGDAGVRVRAPKAGRPTPPTPTPYGEASPEPSPRNWGASTPPPVMIPNMLGPCCAEENMIKIAKKNKQKLACKKIDSHYTQSNSIKSILQLLW